MKHIDICGVNVSVVNLTSASQLIEEWIQAQYKTYICIAPVSTIVDCQSDENYLKIVNNAGMVTPDGMPLVFVGKLHGEKGLSRTYGPDLMLAICNLSQERGYKHYFYGGSEETSRLLVKRLKEKFPKLNIVGRYAPPFRQIHEKEKAEVIQSINQSNPDILWIGLGSPKQDFWMDEHRSLLKVPVIIGIGAAFDFLSGVKRQAPRWMQKSGLEWFFRLCCEPKRLWKRYLIGNPKFFYYLLKDSAKKVFSKNKPCNAN